MLIASDANFPLFPPGHDRRASESKLFPVAAVTGDMVTSLQSADGIGSASVRLTAISSDFGDLETEYCMLDGNAKLKLSIKRNGRHLNTSGALA